MQLLVRRFRARFPTLASFVDKVAADNVGFLASALAWSILTAIIPVIVAILAVGGWVLHSPSAHASLVSRLSTALQGALTRADIDSMVNVSTQHTGLFALIGAAGVVWGASNVGGAVATVFVPIFGVPPRPFLYKKLLDLGMLLAATILLIVILSATAIAGLVDRLSVGWAPPAILPFILATGIAYLAAVVLFAAVYRAFPGNSWKLNRGDIWLGAAVAAALFEAFTFMFPIYARFAHFSHFSAFVFALLVLITWIFCFSFILIAGAEIVAFRTARRSQRRLDQLSDCAAVDSTAAQPVATGEH